MDKEQTRQIKGIAILLMLWLHLFSSEATVNNLCINTIFFWNGQPLAVVLRKLGSLCVTIYIFLSGYGLTKVQSANKSSSNSLKRISNLYLNFILIFLIAYPFGYIFNAQLFRSGIYVFITNLIGLNNSYNGAWWFMLPYCILVLISTPAIKAVSVMNRKKLWLLIFALIAAHVVSYILIGSITSQDIFSLLEINIFRTIYLALPFFCGVIYANYHVIEKFVSFRKQWINLSIILLLCILKLQIGASALLNIPFVLLLIPLFCKIELPHSVATVLLFFGKHSTNMWLCHFFFIRYIAQEYIYTLKYPVIIFIVLIILSVSTSLLINPLLSRIKKLITST